jgi:acyl-coenzyme A synthetase/AMP-(fatty) acid ligase
LAVPATGRQGKHPEIVMTLQIGLFDDDTAAGNRVVMQCPQQGVCVAQLLAAASAVSRQISVAGLATKAATKTQAASPPYVINLCKNRLQFVVGFCAALIAGCTSLLPANRQLHTIAELIDRYPGSLILVDDDSSEFNGFACVDISSISLAAIASSQTQAVAAMPMIPAEHIAAIVFTSGSSGQPTAIAKPWRTFVGTAQLLAQRFAQSQPAAIVATVPPQHMYGLETTVMMALHGGVTVHSGQPFFADDIRAALEQINGPRLLVTTPVHLSALLASATQLAPLAGLISATAPLHQEQAALAEAQLGCQVAEIFGCSEAGSFATRRSCLQQQWTMLEGMTIHQQAGQHVTPPVAEVRGLHLLAAVPLEDQLQLISESQFSYIGRSSDMLNVAGKRGSLADLSHKLRLLDGVDDGVFFLPDNDGVANQRPAALVVSRLTRHQILSALAQSIDPVFLPRPLKIVAEIPRNEVGKIPRQLLQQHLTQ